MQVSRTVPSLPELASMDLPATCLHATALTGAGVSGQRR